MLADDLSKKALNLDIGTAHYTETFDGEIIGDGYYTLFWLAVHVYSDSTCLSWFVFTFHCLFLMDTQLAAFVSLECMFAGHFWHEISDLSIQEWWESLHMIRLCYICCTPLAGMLLGAIFVVWLGDGLLHCHYHVHCLRCLFVSNEYQRLVFFLLKKTMWQF